MSAAAGHLVGALFERIPVSARPALERILRDVQPDPTARPRVFGMASSRRVPLGWGGRADPSATQFVLGDIVGCPDFGPSEKLAWEFALVFEGVPLTLAFQKFGLRAYLDSEVEEAEAIALTQRLIDTIGRALPLLQKTVLATIADEQVAAGMVNVHNHYNKLEAQYSHFRDLAQASLAEATVNEKDDYGKSSVLRQHARFESNATVHAFFSMLEHLLLIGFLLSDHDATNGRLAEFIGLGWSEKFKRIVDLREPDSKRHYDQLVAVHDELRNPSAHGEVHSDGTDFEFLLPNVGPVPTRLVMQGGRRRTYKWRWGHGDDVLAVLADVGEWLVSGPLAGATVYGESGLPLFFVDAIRTDLASASNDPDELDTIIDHLHEMIDRNANMDW